MRLAATEDHVFDLRWIQLRSFPQNVLDGVGGQFFGAGHVERAAKRLRKAGARAGYYYGFSHIGRIFLRLLGLQISNANHDGHEGTRRKSCTKTGDRTRRRCGLPRLISSTAERAPKVRREFV